MIYKHLNAIPKKKNSASITKTTRLMLSGKRFLRIVWKRDIHGVGKMYSSNAKARSTYWHVCSDRLQKGSYFCHRVCLSA
jgi:hypothetical protein